MYQIRILNPEEENVFIKNKEFRIIKIKYYTFLELDKFDKYEDGNYLLFNYFINTDNNKKYLSTMKTDNSTGIIIGYGNLEKISKNIENLEIKYSGETSTIYDFLNNDNIKKNDRILNQGWIKMNCNCLFAQNKYVYLDKKKEKMRAEFSKHNLKIKFRKKEKTAFEGIIKTEIITKPKDEELIEKLLNINIENLRKEDLFL